MPNRRKPAASGEFDWDAAAEARLAQPLADFAGAKHFAAIGWRPYSPGGPEDQAQRRQWMHWSQQAEHRRQTDERRILRAAQIQRMIESIGEGAALLFPLDAAGSDGDGYDNGD